MNESKQQLIDAGFSRAASFLDGTEHGLRLAQGELRRFQPCSIGEARALARAKLALADAGPEER